MACIFIYFPCKHAEVDLLSQQAVIDILEQAVQGRIEPIYSDVEAKAVSAGVEAAQDVEGSFEKAKSAAMVAGRNAKAAALSVFEQSVAAGRAALAVEPMLAVSERAKAAALSAAEVNAGNVFEQLQAAAVAAFATSQDFDDKRAAMIEAATFAAPKLEGSSAESSEMLQQLAGDATLFASAVNLAIQSCKTLKPDEGPAAAGTAAAFYVLREAGGNDLASATAATSAFQTARAAGWTPDAQLEAAISAAHQAGGNPGHLEEIARAAARDAGIEATSQVYQAKVLNLVQKSGDAEVAASSDNDLVAESSSKSFSFARDSSPIRFYDQLEDSPQSNLMETASSLGQTGRFSLGSQRFRGLCTIDEIHSALTDAERCLAAFEEERKIQMSTLQRKRSRNKLSKDRLPKDVELAMTEAQKILSTFDEERRQQLQIFKNSRNRSLNRSMSSLPSFWIRSRSMHWKIQLKLLSNIFIWSSVA